TLVAKVSADSQEEQREVALALTELIDTISGVVDPYTTEEDAIGRVRYRFDREAASRLGVSESAITEVYRLITGPEEVGEWVGSGSREYSPFMVTLPRADQDSPRDIDTLMVKSADGSAVSLGSVLTPAYELRPSRVSFDGALPVSYVTAEVEGRSIVYVVIDTMRTLMRGELAGYEVTSWNLFSLQLQNIETNSELTLRWGGEWEMTLENFRDLGIAMGVALLMVYAVLVAQYNRFATPAYILVTVPLGLVGILWGFLLLDQVFGVYLTATALIGFIALIGLVVNNAIIFLEYVEQMQAAGHSYQSALLEAGQARFRPIFLTSLTTVLGSLTIAGDPVWSGLAWAIVFGLSLSTILTLVIYPTLLMYFVSSKLENNK
ncbi:efflux RND transporter permease subunit, partial [Candidatus Kaiserbacteria bacterium]|nr:efflux RND transporter permease subunit [Candidatus Kaiserbacteria bacterium]